MMVKKLTSIFRLCLSVTCATMFIPLVAKAQSSEVKATGQKKIYILSTDAPVGANKTLRTLLAEKRKKTPDAVRVFNELCDKLNGGHTVSGKAREIRFDFDQMHRGLSKPFFQDFELSSNSNPILNASLSFDDYRYDSWHVVKSYDGILEQRFGFASHFIPTSLAEKIPSIKKEFLQREFLFRLLNKAYAQVAEGANSDQCNIFPVNDLDFAEVSMREFNTTYHEKPSSETMIEQDNSANKSGAPAPIRDAGLPGGVDDAQSKGGGVR